MESATKILLPNQHDLLHPFYGQDDCCLCRAEQRVIELERQLEESRRFAGELTKLLAEFSQNPRRVSGRTRKNLDQEGTMRKGRPVY